MTYSPTKTEQKLTIQNIEEPTIINYFITINQGRFEDTAALFAENGELIAPFEQPIVGRIAIASYLAQEAKGIKLFPQQGIYQITENNLQQILVTGKAKTPLFSVQVTWVFSLNPGRQITMTKIKLLASPQELLSLQHKKNN